jgi:hypothetical protein
MIGLPMQASRAAMLKNALAKNELGEINLFLNCSGSVSLLYIKAP